MLAIPHDLAQYTAKMLSKYYKTFIPPKKVVKELDIYSIIQSFDLPCEVGDHLLDDYTPAKESDDPSTVKLLLKDELKDETGTNLLDLGIGNIFVHPHLLHITLYSRYYTISGKWIEYASDMIMM